MEVDFVASEPHFLDHLAPIARESLARGHPTRFLIGEEAESAVSRHPDLDFDLGRPGNARVEGRITVCASIGDAVNAQKHLRAVILCEHGSGQSYGDRNRSYVGGEARERFVGVLVPNAMAAARHQRHYPRGPEAMVIGSPRVEDLVARFGSLVRHRSPTVAVSWHWDCPALPETESAFDAIGDGVLHELQRLQRLGWINLIGHQHPRATKPVIAYEERGINFYESFDDICVVADVYMVDNSSTLFEFAALDRPVIVMNSPNYRRKVKHGLRFWDEAGIGPNVWRQRDVAYAVASALEDGPARQEERRRIVERVYPVIEGSAKMAVDAIEVFAQRRAA